MAMAQNEEENASPVEDPLMGTASPTAEKSQGTDPTELISRTADTADSTNESAVEVNLKQNNTDVEHPDESDPVEASID